MLLIFVVIILNLVLGFAAAVVLGYGPPGLAEIWVAASGEMAGHRQEAAKVASSQPAEPAAGEQPGESAPADQTAQLSEQPSTPPSEPPSKPPSKPPSEQRSEQPSEQPADHASDQPADLSSSGQPAEAAPRSSSLEAQATLASHVEAELTADAPAPPLPTADGLPLSEATTAVP